MNKEIIIKEVAGMDNGNDSMKQTFYAGETKHLYQNVYGTIGTNRDAIDKKYEVEGYEQSKVVGKSIKKYLDVSLKKLDKDKKVIDEFNVLLGALAVDTLNSKDIKEREREFKHTDKELVYNSIITSVNSIITDRINKPVEEITILLDVGIGLPIKEFNSKDVGEAYSERYVGNYDITFNHPKYPVKKVKVSINKAIVAKEGYAALQETLIEDGIFDNEEVTKLFRNKHILMIDGGCFSFDVGAGRIIFDKDDEIYVFKNKHLLTKGFSEGIGNVLDNIIKRIEIKHSDVLGNNKKISRNEITDAVRYEDGYLDGTDIDITDIYNEEMKDFAINMADKISGLIKESEIVPSSIKRIYLTGGGAEIKVFIETFKKCLSEHFNFDESIFVKVKDPVFQNANAYLTLAVAESDLIEE